ncbi:guanine nucleotide-binding protein-like 1 [Symsagittifera roscoffensis]|uniref:guanine nucleotide-binding protein-like 1 n=1 Tax=Symsagittifera roscoffensis TaxID=84072 RepID=UPI00307C0395
MDISVFGKIKTARRKPTAKCNYAPPIGLQELLSACEKCIRNNKNKGKRDFDFTAWQYKVSKQMSRNYDYREATMCAADQRLTIGCVGHPNVGKSSVINSIIGKKVVSTSRTPGHTKHFQTHFVTCNVQLCDCPGLVFPSIVDKQQQIFSGLFPIAQVQEPYTPVGFIADRLPLVEMLGLKHPQGEGEQWTAWDVCEAWAVKRGFRIARTSKFDVYRAANHLLRLTVEGRICMATYPPNYFSEEHMWRSSEETKQLIKLVEGSKVGAAGGGWDVSESSSRSKSRDTLAIDVERNQMSDDSRSLSPGNSARSGERESENEEEGEGDNVNAQRSSPSEGGSTRKGSKKERKASDSARVANKFSELLDFSSD